jgi:hypothetical protein
MDDFIEELLAKGYVKKDLKPDGNGDGIGFKSFFTYPLANNSFLITLHSEIL